MGLLVFSEAFTAFRAKRRFMSESHVYSIFTSSDRSSVRLGWVSLSTGLTYCGICLRAPVAAEVGAECNACGAQVSRLFDLNAGTDSITQAWREASQPAAMRLELERTGT